MSRKASIMALAARVFKTQGAMIGCRAEVAELGDALDSKSSGALPRAGSIPAFGIGLAVARGPSMQATDVTDASKLGANG